MSRPTGTMYNKMPRSHVVVLPDQAWPSGLSWWTPHDNIVVDQELKVFIKDHAVMYPKEADVVGPAIRVVHTEDEKWHVYIRPDDSFTIAWDVSPMFIDVDWIIVEEDQ